MSVEAGRKGREAATPGLWERVWQGPAEPRAVVCEAVRVEERGVRWRCLVSYLERHLGALGALEAVELGCGAALYGLLLARQGTRVTLVDFSHAALARARWRAHALGLDTSPDRGRVRLVEADIASFAAGVPGRFDLAISLGTVEHYPYPERLELCRAHRLAVRPGGVVAISAPNRHYLPHEALKLGLRMRRKWLMGYEHGFTRRELARVGRALGLEATVITGTRIGTDLAQTLDVVRGTAAYRRWVCRFGWERGCEPGRRVGRARGGDWGWRHSAGAHASPRRVWGRWLDDRLGRDLTLLGVVPGEAGG